MAQDGPTLPQIRELVDQVLNEFFDGFKDDFGADGHPFANEEDEDAFRELLVTSTDRNKKNLWKEGKWDEKVIDEVKKTAKKHGKRCAAYAKKYKKQTVTLARVLVELRECKTACYEAARFTKEGPLEARGFVCDI